MTTEICKECGSTHLTWQTSIINRSDVQQGRLNTRDVECLFFLGCDDCSETLETISAEGVARLMNMDAESFKRRKQRESELFAALEVAEKAIVSRRADCFDVALVAIDAAKGKS